MLQLVLYRAGYGKTEYVFSSIKTLVEKRMKVLFSLRPSSIHLLPKEGC